MRAGLAVCLIGVAAVAWGGDEAHMAAVPAGGFTRGADELDEDEKPPREVHLDAFHIDVHETSVAQFAAFVDATGYRTMAEREGWAYPAGASPYGVHDMAGNAWEWVTDWYSSGYYRRAPAHNPPGPDSGRERVLRGGGWYLDPLSLRTAGRYSEPPTMRNDLIGFRCALSTR
ncbi:MAG: SUMF1/EgtB/PvdO family nonheme iron enzyme [Candidatus Rokubacteria bacterium]|nr:SUMF1/EgtB/PvdO family nonheme iron enzyme [Candidatus Rokubacteria bacterium]